MNNDSSSQQSYWPEKEIILKENNKGLYSVHVYLISKHIADFIYDLALSTIASTIFYWIVGLHPEFKRYLLAMLVAFIVAQAASSAGMDCTF